MRRVIMILVGLALVAPLTIAQVPKTVTVEHATERVDGTALPIDQIQRVEVECMVDGSGELIASGIITPPSTSLVTGEVFTEGSYICRARTVDTFDQASPDWTVSNVFTVRHPCEENPGPETCAEPMAPKSISIPVNL